MVRFVNEVVEVFGPQYCIEPTIAETKSPMEISEARIWLGMLESLDYVHWRCKNFSYALQGQYQDCMNKTTIILEAFASHAHFMQR